MAMHQSSYGLWNFGLLSKQLVSPTPLPNISLGLLKGGPIYITLRGINQPGSINLGKNTLLILVNFRQFQQIRFCTNFAGKCHSALLTGARGSPTPNCTEGTWVTRNKQQQDLNQFFRRPTRKYPMNFSDPRKRQGRTFLILFFFLPLHLRVAWHRFFSFYF